MVVGSRLASEERRATASRGRIAIATQLPYALVYDRLAALEAEKGRPRSARNGIMPVISKQFLRDLGWVWTPTMQIGSGCRVHLRAGELPEEGPLICSCSKHLVAVVDGVIRDIADPSRAGTRCVYGYWQPSQPIA